jgi:membrane-associated phospholipid phosphatase
MDFNMDVMLWLSEHRMEPFSTFFIGVSGLGEIEGYVLICCLILAAYSRPLALRLTIVVTATMCVNHLLKMVIANPRPFIESGEYQSRWLVPPENATELATEYSTPSGHAMAAAAFYVFLGLAVQNKVIRAICLVAALMTGFARPYLGVHYVEDILLGWMVGLVLGVLAFRSSNTLSDWWKQLELPSSIALLLGGSVALWFLSIAIDSGVQGHQPRAFLAYAGILSGAAISSHFETANTVASNEGTVGVKLVRFALLTAVALGLLEGSEFIIALFSHPYSISGFGLQYARYLLAGMVVFAFMPRALFSLNLR